MSPRSALAMGMLFAPLMVGCRGNQEPAQSSPGLVSQARLGVFYGGQVQERQEIPRHAEAKRQAQGFRIVLARPLEHDVRISWEVEMPGSREGGVQSLKQTKLGESTLRAGQRQLDQLVELEPSDPLGLWNVRVMVGQELVIDRAWHVFDPRARRRALEDEN